MSREDAIAQEIRTGRPVDQFFPNRKLALQARVCMERKSGCKVNVNIHTMSELQFKEYLISGLCPDCQRSFFGA